MLVKWYIMTTMVGNGLYMDMVGYNGWVWLLNVND